MQQQFYSVQLLCKMLNVSRSAYYAWSKGESYQQNKNKQEEELELIKAFNRHRRRYGVRRLVPELQEEGFHASFHQVRKTMRKWGLKAIQRHRPSDTLFHSTYY